MSDVSSVGVVAVCVALRSYERVSMCGEQTVRSIELMFDGMNKFFSIFFFRIAGFYVMCLKVYFEIRKQSVVRPTNVRTPIQFNQSATTENPMQAFRNV